MTRIASSILLMVMTFTPAVAQPQFDRHWYDGKAELDGYRLVVSRYGENRSGTAVMVFVTEPFSESMRVKMDDADANPGDTFTALKLNLVRDFQTGVYDYNTMVSVFARAETMEPVKVSFSSAEWCGHVYGEMVFRPKGIRGTTASYFEGESGPLDLGRPEGGVTEDELFIALRGLRTDFMAPGETRAVPYLPGMFYSRLSHRAQQWTQAVISRAAAPESIKVPAGTFDVSRYDVKIADGRVGIFYIEDAYPHRIVKWSLPPDVNGELTGSTRLQYWKTHGEGDESYLEQMGLRARE
jgi:hypothetical protein